MFRLGCSRMALIAPPMNAPNARPASAIMLPTDFSVGGIFLRTFETYLTPLPIGVLLMRPLAAFLTRSITFLKSATGPFNKCFKQLLTELQFLMRSM